MCMYVFIYVCICVCMHLCIYIYIQSKQRTHCNYTNLLGIHKSPWHHPANFPNAHAAWLMTCPVMFSPHTQEIDEADGDLF